MDNTCPHCHQSLARRQVKGLQRPDAVVAGDATHQCPLCGGGLMINRHAGEGALPFGLDLEVAVYLVGGAALALAAALSAVVPPLLTASAVVFACVTGGLAQRSYFYGVTLAQWPRYRAGIFRYIEQCRPPG